jgi:hypothetical protein
MSASYQSSHLKRVRSTKAEVDRRRDALWYIVKDMKPMTVRQVFYQASVEGIVAKTEAGYDKVQTDLAWMRRAGIMPYTWLADSTRWQRRPNTYTSIQEALEETARLYRKSLWVDANAYVEVWLEKDALAGVVTPITYAYDVALMVARGYASLSFLHGAAQKIKTLEVPAYIYHFGDYDPSGVDAAEKIEQTLKEMAPDAEIHFDRCAVLPTQISMWDLPTRPTKTTDSRSKNFGDISVELDAIRPDVLRDLVEKMIQIHLPAEQLKVLRAAEESERQLLDGLVGMMTGEAQ